MLARESVEVPGPAADRLGEIARENGSGSSPASTSATPSGPATLYNSLLYHAPDGELAIHHRKLVPTNHERLDLGPGRRRRAARAADADRPHRRADLLGELHAARALRAVRVRRRDLHCLDRRRRRRVAGDARPHRARVARVRRRACHFQRADSYPDDFPLATSSPGGHARPRRLGDPRPDGAYLAGPLYDEEGILYADLEPQRLAEERQRFDPAGHYHRPDVLQLHVRPLRGETTA